MGKSFSGFAKFLGDSCIRCILILGVLLLFSCELSTKVEDPFADRQLSQITIAQIFEEEEEIFPGRWETVQQRIDTTYTGNKATLLHEDGMMTIELESVLANETLKSTITGGFEGERFLGEYPIVPFNPDSLYREERFTVQMERIVGPGIVQPPYEGGHEIEEEVHLSYYSESGDFQAFVFRPGIRLQGNVSFTAVPETTQVIKEKYEQLGFDSVPKEVQIEVSFNAIPE